MRFFKGLLFILPLAFLSCGDDDTVSCVTCSTSFTDEFVLCNESNGNASVNGEDTGVSYAVYLQDLQQDGVNCN
jgi:hypothetical protein